MANQRLLQCAYQKQSKYSNRVTRSILLAGCFSCHSHDEQCLHAHQQQHFFKIHSQNQVIIAYQVVQLTRFLSKLSHFLSALCINKKCVINLGVPADGNSNALLHIACHEQTYMHSSACKQAAAHPGSTSERWSLRQQHHTHCVCFNVAALSCY